MPSTLAKKTKQEILAEYEQLANQLEDLKNTSKMVHLPENQELAAAAKNQTEASVSQAVAEIKKTIAVNLEELSVKLNSSLAGLSAGIFSEAKKFTELQQAVELSKKNLALHYNIQVAAETIEQLVNDFAVKKQQLEKEFSARQEQLEVEINNKKRDWQRQLEEYDYNTQLERKRDEALFAETRAKKENELADRESGIKNQEQEIVQLKKQVEQLPEAIAKEAAAREKEITKRLENDYAAKINGLKKDWEAEKKLADMKTQNLVDLAKKQEQEIVSLKKETELANKKAQELAVRIIESGSAKMKIGEDATAAKAN